MSLAAFYAPRGIPPGAVLAMSPAEREVLRIARAQYYEEFVTIIHNAIVTALNPESEDGNGN